MLWKHTRSLGEGLAPNFQLNGQKSIIMADTQEALDIKTKSSDSVWVAIDLIDGETILGEGKTAEEAKLEAGKTEKPYMISYVYKPGTSYIL